MGYQNTIFCRGYREDALIIRAFLKAFLGALKVDRWLTAEHSSDDFKMQICIRLKLWPHEI